MMNCWYAIGAKFISGAQYEGAEPTLPYSDKRKQLSNMTFLINEQNVSVMYICTSLQYHCVLT